MEIKKENLLAVLNTAPENVKEILFGLFPEIKEEEAQKAAKRPVEERIKTFEDAVNELGEDHLYVQMFRDIFTKSEKAGANINSDVVAFLKLRIICAALNEGWQPQFTEDEWRWFPWFTLWTEEELSQKSDEWKAARSLIQLGDEYLSDYAGLASARSHIAPSATAADIGSRLCLKSEALATFCGKQFISLWADFYLNRKSK